MKRNFFIVLFLLIQTLCIKKNNLKKKNETNKSNIIKIIHFYNYRKY